MSTAKLLAAVAAVLVMIVGGSALVMTGGVTPQPTALRTALPSAAPTPKPTSAAALLPGEFTACVPSNQEFKTGTDDTVTEQGPDGDMTIQRRRGFTWRGTITSTDPRFSGTDFYSFDADSYSLASGGPAQETFAETHRIENEGGAWQGSTSGISLPDGTSEGGLVVLMGEGDYAGLKAALISLDAGGCFFSFRGIVTNVPDPPVPYTGG